MPVGGVWYGIIQCTRSLLINLLKCNKQFKTQYIHWLFGIVTVYSAYRFGIGVGTGSGLLFLSWPPLLSTIWFQNTTHDKHNLMDRKTQKCKKIYILLGIIGKSKKKKKNLVPSSVLLIHQILISITLVRTCIIGLYASRSIPTHPPTQKKKNHKGYIYIWISKQEAYLVLGIQ